MSLFNVLSNNANFCLNQFRSQFKMLRERIDHQREIDNQLSEILERQRTQKDSM